MACDISVFQCIWCLNGVKVILEPVAGSKTWGAFHCAKDSGNFGRKLKLNGPFRFLPTGIFGITSGGGPLTRISVGIFRPKFVVPFLTNRFFALIREFGIGIQKGKNLSYWLARFNWKMSFHFPLILACEQALI